MSAKQFTLAFVGVFLILGFGYAATGDLVKRKDQVQFQKVQLKSDSTKIKELDVQYDNLNNRLEKANEQKTQNAQELEKIKQQKSDLEKQKQDLEKQLQAKLETKSKLAAASDSLLNGVTGTGTASAASLDIRGIITAAANKYGLSPSYMIRVATCESSLDPNKVNHSYYAGGGNPSGLYQFIPSTWVHYSHKAGYGGASVFNPVAAANVASYAFAHGHSGEWACA